jgi:hypothetical protein
MDHPVQRALVEDQVRFKVVPAGRRSGKTERVKRYMARAAMRDQGNYFIAAPTRDQVKRIYWNDMKRLSFTSILPDKPSETELTIKYPNGSTLSLIGLDQPQRMEGSFWTGGAIDEIADVKETAWAENISPALDTYNPERPDYRAWCILLGVPDGMNHYYDMAEYARTANDPDWKLYTWPSSDILPPDLVDAARRRMSLRQFRQEYEASFETSTGRIYEDYSKANHTDSKIEKHEQLFLTCDFNYSPMSSAVAVVRGGVDIYFLDEIILVSAVARQTALEFCEKYKDHENRYLVLAGDPAGKAGEKHYQSSDFTSMEEVLRDNGWYPTRNVAPSTLSIKAGQNAVRAKIMNAAGEVSLYVNPNTAPWIHKALSTGSLKKGSSFIEDESNETQHVGTAVRYLCDYLFPVESNETGRVRLRGSI